MKTTTGNIKNEKKMMTFLLEQRGTNVMITEKMMRIIAKRFDKKMMTFLLEQHGPDVMITQEVIKAAAENSKRG